jgi:hypothetical protein
VNDIVGRDGMFHTKFSNFSPRRRIRGGVRNVSYVLDMIFGGAGG